MPEATTPARNGTGAIRKSITAAATVHFIRGGTLEVTARPVGERHQRPGLHDLCERLRDTLSIAGEMTAVVRVDRSIDRVHDQGGQAGQPK